MKIFLTGASGYIGSSVAQRLVSEGAAVRGLIRDAAKADLCKHFGVAPVVGDLDDSDLLSAEARAADAVVHTADSDHRPAAQALVDALTGTGKTLLHTSGISVIGDEACGEPSNRVHLEADPLVPAPARGARVDVDRLVLNAAGCRSVVLCNALVFGDAVSDGAESVLIAALARAAIATGQARVVGRGLNRWSTVHVGDLADLYSLAMQRRALGFMYVEHGEQQMRAIGQAIADRFRLGTVLTTPWAEAQHVFGEGLARYALGSNARVRGRRATALGWRPNRPSIVDWIRSPQSALLAHE